MWSPDVHLAATPSWPQSSVDLGHGTEPWVILSNNSRNRNPLVGYVLVDDIVQLYRDELTEPLKTAGTGSFAAACRNSAAS